MYFRKLIPAILIQKPQGHDVVFSTHLKNVLMKLDPFP